MDDLEKQIAARTAENPDFPRLMEEAAVRNNQARIERFLTAYQKEGSTGAWIKDSDYQFAEVFPNYDLALFASELRAAGQGLADGSVSRDDYWQMILDWQATARARAVSDPEMLAVLNDRPQEDGDIIERPES